MRVLLAIGERIAASRGSQRPERPELLRVARAYRDGLDGVARSSAPG